MSPCRPDIQINGPFRWLSAGFLGQHLSRLWTPSRVLRITKKVSESGQVGGSHEEEGREREFSDARAEGG